MPAGSLGQDFFNKRRIAPHSVEYRAANRPELGVTGHIAQSIHPVTTRLVRVVHGIWKHRLDCPDKPGNDDERRFPL
jgi:hypothetical protein